MNREGQPLVLGHRGASAEAPENTLAAFRLALEEGADGIELDVWRCASGEVVVHHDADTARTAGEAVTLRAANLATLRGLDVGVRRGERFRGERIPLLAEVLEELPGAFVNVEMKSSGPPDLGLPGAVARLIREFGAVDRCLVSSFDAVLLAASRLLAPELARGYLVEDERSWSVKAALGTRLLRPRAIHPESTLATPARVERWRQSGLEVNVWTVDFAEDARRLARLGVSALITNRPALVRGALRHEP
jgi:glycerophosphoryl diester phosphodiesterase